MKKQRIKQRQHQIARQKKARNRQPIETSGIDFSETVSAPEGHDPETGEQLTGPTALLAMWQGFIHGRTLTRTQTTFHNEDGTEEHGIILSDGEIVCDPDGEPNPSA